MTISPTQKLDPTLKLVVEVSENVDMIYCYIKDVKILSGKDGIKNLQEDKPDFSAAIIAYIPPTCTAEEFKRIKNEHRFCVAYSKNDKITDIFVHSLWQKRFAEREVTDLVLSFYKPNPAGLGFIEELEFDKNNVESKVIPEQVFKMRMGDCEKELNKLNGRTSGLLGSLTSSLKSLIVRR
ncbi:MAG: hypothetical protein ACSNEK_09640 [Parachlamydiaceae bacterium]